jgi:deazaflavin-dependent oxidoreductase (nitroreductase family)
VFVHDRNVKMLSTLHTALYRATRGMIGRRLVNNDMLLLTTTGAATGEPHTVPLLYLKDGERLVIIASYGGRPSHPQWYRNLMRQPAASVQILGETREVVATAMTSAEREQWWPMIVEAYGDYSVYQSRTEREIPVVWLD